MFAALLSVATISPSAAQELRSPILTIDSDRLYAQSAFGQSVEAQAEAQLRAHGLQNREIEAELEAEELELAKRRDSVDVAEFRIMADAFDAKVQAIRAQRIEERNAIEASIEQRRGDFLRIAAPLLEELMREVGAAVVLEQRSVFVSATAIDITDEVIRRLDAIETPADAQ